MALLKEDGSLDIERINQLPLKEKKKEIGSFTREQYKEYLASVPINDGNEHTKAITGSRTIEEALASGCVYAQESINNIGKKCRDKQ